MTMRRMDMESCCSRACVCPRRICFLVKDAASRLRRGVWGRAAFIIACDRSGWRNARRHISASAKERVAFGKPLSDNDVTQERIAQARIEIDGARLLVLQIG